MAYKTFETNDAVHIIPLGVFRQSLMYWTLANFQRKIYTCHNWELKQQNRLRAGYSPWHRRQHRAAAGNSVFGHL